MKIYTLLMLFMLGIVTMSFTSSTVDHSVEKKAIKTELSVNTIVAEWQLTPASVAIIGVDMLSSTQVIDNITLTKICKCWVVDCPYAWCIPYQVDCPCPPCNCD